MVEVLNGNLRNLIRKWKVVSLDESIKTGTDANDAEDDADDNDEDLPGNRLNVQCAPLQLHVKVARPDEGKHRSGEAADKAHQNGKVRNGNYWK